MTNGTYNVTRTDNNAFKVNSKLKIKGLGGRLHFTNLSLEVGISSALLIGPQTVCGLLNFCWWFFGSFFLVYGWFPGDLLVVFDGFIVVSWLFVNTFLY